MKRTLTLCLALAMALTLCACGGKTSKERDYWNLGTQS